MSFPLHQAKLCMDCDFVFAGGDSTCIKCGSSAWFWLSKYIKDLKEAKEKVGRIGDTNEYVKDVVNPICNRDRGF